MTTLGRHLSAYAAYHRDRRNVATHLIGIPMIVLAVEILLSRPVWALEYFTFTPAVLTTIVVSFYYLKLDRRLGGAMALCLILGARIGLELALLDTATWLSLGAGLFVVGWIFQLVGHGFEGRKPAFLDDIRSLLIGPLYVAAELSFLLGWRRDLRDQIEGSKAH